MSQNDSLSEFVLPIGADGKMSEIGSKSTPFFDLSDVSPRLLAALKMATEGTRKRQFESAEDLKENSPVDAKDACNTPKNTKFNDCLGLKSTQAFTQSLDALKRDTKLDSPKNKKLNKCFGLKSKPAVTLSLDDLMKDGGEEMKLLCAKWSQMLSEHENFETLIPARVDKLLKDALACEENLIKQKEKLKGNILALTSIWKQD